MLWWFVYLCFAIVALRSMRKAGRPVMKVIYFLTWAGFFVAFISEVYQNTLA